VADGYAIRVSDNSQVGFSSDYNLFRIGAGGHLGLWAGSDFDNRAGWVYTLGFDVHSIVTDPDFIDPTPTLSIRLERTGFWAARRRRSSTTAGSGLQPPAAGWRMCPAAMTATH